VYVLQVSGIISDGRLRALTKCQTVSEYQIRKLLVSVRNRKTWHLMTCRCRRVLFENRHMPPKRRVHQHDWIFHMQVLGWLYWRWRKLLRYK